MEQTIFEPLHRGPRHQRVELNDLSDFSAAAAVPENYVPEASAEHIDYLWQREAAISALNGIKKAADRGLHRREESLAEIARDEISIRAKRLFGKIASIGSGLREWGRGIRESFAVRAEDPGTLADLGFAGAEYTERHLGRRHNPSWAEVDTLVPDSPARATSSFTPEELAELRRVVHERRQEHGVSRVYESQNI